MDNNILPPNMEVYSVGKNSVMSVTHKYEGEVTGSKALFIVYNKNIRSDIAQYMTSNGLNYPEHLSKVEYKDGPTLSIFESIIAPHIVIDKSNNRELKVRASLEEIGEKEFEKYDQIREHTFNYFGLLDGETVVIMESPFVGRIEPELMKQLIIQTHISLYDKNGAIYKTVDELQPIVDSAYAKFFNGPKNILNRIFNESLTVVLPEDKIKRHVIEDEIKKDLADLGLDNIIEFYKVLKNLP